MNWLFNSNRRKHFAAGALIEFMTVGLIASFVNSVTAIIIIPFWTTFVAAISVECKDKLWGGKFDWLDVLATILTSLGFVAGVIISQII